MRGHNGNCAKRCGPRLEIDVASSSGIDRMSFNELILECIESGYIADPEDWCLVLGLVEIRSRIPI